MLLPNLSLIPPQNTPTPDWGSKRYPEVLSIVPEGWEGECPRCGQGDLLPLTDEAWWCTHCLVKLQLKKS